MMTLEEIIEMMLDLQKTQPKNRNYPIGLYIETKMYMFYLEKFGIDSAEKLYEILKKYDLETIEKSQNKLPIIVECFEHQSLKKFGTLSDLPLIFLMNTLNIKTQMLSEIVTYAHGIGPSVSQLYEGSFFKAAKSLDLKVHPYFLTDDTLHFTKNPIDETVYYLNHDPQIDGLFTEFPHTTVSIFEDHLKTKDGK